jgi:hypothetical protein
MHINAGWELKTNKKYICRWFVAWSKLGQDDYVGAIAGYSGGGTFIIERFYARARAGLMISLWIDFTDKISGEEIDFNNCSNEALLITEKCIDIVWDWNNNEFWNSDDEIILNTEKIRSLVKGGKDILLLNTGFEKILKIICDKAGLTAYPKK